MSGMNQPTLPIPCPGDWATRSAVAEHLDVDPATVSRIAAAGRLTVHTPRTATYEAPRPMYWWPEVLEYARAREIVTGPRQETL